MAHHAPYPGGYAGMHPHQQPDASAKPKRRWGLPHLFQHTERQYPFVMEPDGSLTPDARPFGSRSLILLIVLLLHLTAVFVLLLLAALGQTSLLQACAVGGCSKGAISIGIFSASIKSRTGSSESFGSPFSPWSGALEDLEPKVLADTLPVTEQIPAALLLACYITLALVMTLFLAALTTMMRFNNNLSSGSAVTDLVPKSERALSLLSFSAASLLVPTGLCFGTAVLLQRDVSSSIKAFQALDVYTGAWTYSTVRQGFSLVFFWIALALLGLSFLLAVYLVKRTAEPIAAASAPSMHTQPMHHTGHPHQPPQHPPAGMAQAYHDSFQAQNQPPMQPTPWAPRGPPSSSSYESVLTTTTASTASSDTGGSASSKKRHTHANLRPEMSEVHHASPLLARSPIKSARRSPAAAVKASRGLVSPFAPVPTQPISPTKTHLATSSGKRAHAPASHKAYVAEEETSDSDTSMTEIPQPPPAAQPKQHKIPRKSVYQRSAAHRPKSKHVRLPTPGSGQHFDEGLPLKAASDSSLAALAPSRPVIFEDQMEQRQVEPAATQNQFAMKPIKSLRSLTDEHHPEAVAREMAQRAQQQPDQLHPTFAPVSSTYRPPRHFAPARDQWRGNAGVLRGVPGQAMAGFQRPPLPHNYRYPGTAV